MSETVTPYRKLSKYVTGVLAFLVTIATFDPHFENLPLVTYGLYAFLPELTLLAAFACLWLAVRAGLVRLVARHWRLLGVLALVVGWLAWDKAETMALTSTGARRQDLKVYQNGLRAPVESWLRQRRIAYSSAQADMFRADMRIRAVDAFASADISGATSYLRAGRRALRDDYEAEQFDSATAFLIARERYLDNHRARISDFAARSPMAPARLYLMRAVEELTTNTHGSDPELIKVEARLRSAMPNARSTLETCLKANTVPAFDDDARALIILTFEVIGNLPYPAPVGSDQRGWCSALRTTSQAERFGTGSMLLQRFDQIAHNLWGVALDEFAERGAPY